MRRVRDPAPVRPPWGCRAAALYPRRSGSTPCAGSPLAADRGIAAAARGLRRRERADPRGRSRWRSTSRPTPCTRRSTPRPQGLDRGTASPARPPPAPRPTRSSCWPPAGPTSRWWTSTTWAWRASAARTSSGVGALVQRPLAAVIARAGRSGARATSRAGAWASPGLPSDDAVLRAVVERDGGDYSKVRRITIGFAAVPSLIEGKVDAVRGVLERRGRGAAPARRVARASSAWTTTARRATPSWCCSPRADGRDRRDASRATLAACATAPTRCCATATPRSRDRARPRARDEPSSCAPSSSGRTGLLPAAAAAPRGARGLGALRRALRDPERAAGRGARRSAL